MRLYSLAGICSVSCIVSQEHYCQHVFLVMLLTGRGNAARDETSFSAAHEVLAVFCIFSKHVIEGLIFDLTGAVPARSSAGFLSLIAKLRGHRAQQKYSRHF